MGVHPAPGWSRMLFTVEKIRGAQHFCPIHRFDGKDQIPGWRHGLAGVEFRGKFRGIL